MRLVEHTDHACILCGRGNTPNNDGSRPKFVDLERDVNWNDPVVVCEDCAMKIGALAGMLSSEERLEYEQVIRRKNVEIHNLQTQMDDQESRAARAIARAAKDAASEAAA